MRNPADNEVRVWLVRLDEFMPLRARLSACLSSDEQARANRFHFQEHADHFTICRGLLRELLAQCLILAAADIRFEYSDTGKPALDQAQNSRQLTFNLSHSGGFAAIAIARATAIGIDIEQIDKTLDVEPLAQRVLSEAERSELAAVASGERKRAFLRFWTHKEAYVKARGEGLAAPLHAIEIRLPRGGLPGWLTDARDPMADRSWTLHELQLDVHYVGALAAQRSNLTVSQSYLSPPRGSEPIQAF